MLGKTRRRAGQSMVEFALCVPLLALLLLGGYDVSVLIVDQVIADNAVRHGARLASLLGGDKNNPTGTTDAQVNQQIIQNVLAVAAGMRNATLLELDIYRPTAPNGAYKAGDKVYKYDGSGNPLPLCLTGCPTFPLTDRVQTVPNETSIGVRLVWQYNPPTTWGSFTMTLSDYMVMRGAPLVV
jgi:Flp pilus assembly protein TadG